MSLAPRPRASRSRIVASMSRAWSGLELGVGFARARIFHSKTRALDHERDLTAYFLIGELGHQLGQAATCHLFVQLRQFTAHGGTARRATVGD